MVGRIEHVTSGKVAHVTSLRELVAFLTDVLRPASIARIQPRRSRVGRRNHPAAVAAVQ
jgi:hypothetical protein